MVSPIRLRLHVTKEVPLPPFIYNRSCRIKDNVDLGWRESKERKLLIMLSYFVNLVTFYLILIFKKKEKVFTPLSMVIKEKFSK